MYEMKFIKNHDRVIIRTGGKYWKGAALRCVASSVGVVLVNK